MKRPTKEELDMFKKIYGKNFSPSSRLDKRRMGRIQNETRPNNKKEKKSFYFNRSFNRRL